MVCRFARDKCGKAESAKVQGWLQADIVATLSPQRRTCRASVTCASAKPDNRYVPPEQTRAGCAV